MLSADKLPTLQIVERSLYKFEAQDRFNARRMARLSLAFVFMIVCIGLAPSIEAQQTVVSVTATQPIAGATPGVFTIKRGDTSQASTVLLSVSGTAVQNVDYTLESSATATNLAPAIVPGKVGQAFSFDGRSRYVQASDDPRLDPTEEATIDAWVFFNQLPSASTEPVMVIADKSDFARDFRLDARPDNKFHFYIGAGGLNVASATTIQTGQWYHVAATYKALTEIKIYVNGALENRLAIDQRRAPSTQVPFTIGRTLGLDFLVPNASFFNGLIDEVHVFNRVLSDGEIRSIFTADTAGLCKPNASVTNCVQPPSGLVGWFTGDGDGRNLAENIFPAGKVGQAFSFNTIGTQNFNNVAEYVQYPSLASQDPTSEITVDAWVNFTALPSETGTSETILDKSAINDALSLVALTNGDRIGFFFGFDAVATTTQMQKGKWYHIAATYKAGVEMRIYVNGVLENTQKVGANGRGQNDNPLTIGNAATDRTRAFNGQIDEAQMYSRALSVAEIQAIYNADSAGLCKPTGKTPNCVSAPAGLVGWWAGDGNATDLITRRRGTLFGYDYRLIGQQLTFPSGQTTTTINVKPLFSPNSGGRSVILTILPDPQNAYTVDTFKRSATVFLSGKAATTDVALSSVFPNNAGNTGLVTTTISGQGFQSGVTVKLVRAGQPDIVTAQTAPALDQTSLNATFDLTGVSPGVYDVVVANAGGTAKTLAGAFTITQGGTPILSVDVIGRNQIRAGRQQTYTILYANSGDMDAYAVPVYITFPKFLSWQPGFTVLRPRQPATPPNSPPLDFDKLPRDIQIGDNTVVTLFVPIMRANSAGTLPLIFTLPDDPQFGHIKFTIDAKLGPPLYDPHTKSLIQGQMQRLLTEGVLNSPPMKGNVASGKCVRDIIDATFNGIGGVVPGGGCVASVGAFLANSFADNVATVLVQSSGGDPQAASVGGDVFGSALFTAASCAGQSIPGFGQAISGAQAAAAIVNASQDCRGGDGGSKGAEGVTSDDPNDKAGTDGAGDNHYIAGSKRLPYTIYFENEDTASAPAQDVTVTDQLDPAKVDLSTFSFSAITFGKQRFTPPFGQQSFTSIVDLRPDNNLLLKITANLNTSTGLVTWTFNSLDPATGRAPDDPQAGFLPPNKTSPQGQASVTFNVKAKASLATNTRITNNARIVFDVNAPIDTATVLNTIDKTAPASAVQVLPASVPYSFVINWSGTDQGSGINSYTVYVSDNNAAYAPFITTADTSTVFTGQAGHTYKFYTLATDQVGNSEAAKTQAEATTTINVSAGNAIDEATFFVSQHYRDFLNRTPDASGFNFWVNQIASCNGNVQCIDIKRQNVSAAYFLSTEFQQTGFLVYKLYKAAYGNIAGKPVPVKYGDFIPDVQAIGFGVVVTPDNANGYKELLESNKGQFLNSFVTRDAFRTQYPDTLTAAQYVDKLNQNTGGVLTQPERNALVNGLTSGAETRATVLRKVAENSVFDRAEFSKAFVLMQYFGYLRRDPDAAPDSDFSGYNFWLNKLNSFGGDYIRSEMVRSFILSTEYRKRFGQP